MTNDELAAIKARADMATPGPWEKRGRTVGMREVSCEIVGAVGPGYATPVCQLSTGFYRYEGDKDFIAHSRTDIPALIAEVERLQAGLTAIEARWREASQNFCFHRHYREIIEICADELRYLLGGADDREVQDEISKAFEAGEA